SGRVLLSVPRRDGADGSRLCDRRRVAALAGAHDRPRGATTASLPLRPPRRLLAVRRPDRRSGLLLAGGPVREEHAARLHAQGHRASTPQALDKGGVPRVLDGDDPRPWVPDISTCHACAGLLRDGVAI